jgi:hypothetical protein
MNVEDNIGDSTLQRMWKAGHIIVDTTNTKIENGLKKYGLDKVHDEVVKLRQKNDEIHDHTKKSFSILKTWANMIKQGAKDLRD